MSAGTHRGAGGSVPAMAAAAGAEECAVCMEPMGQGTGRTKVASFACSHEFCTVCDRELYQRLDDRCPMCRSPRRSFGTDTLVGDVREMHRRRILGEAQRRPADLPHVSDETWEQAVAEVGRALNARPVPLRRQTETMFFPIDTTGLFGPEATPTFSVAPNANPRPAAATLGSGYTHGYPEDMIPGTEAELDALDALSDMDDYGFPSGRGSASVYGDLAALTPSARALLSPDRGIRAGLMGLLNVDRFNLRDFVSATQRGRRGEAA